MGNFVNKEESPQEIHYEGHGGDCGTVPEVIQAGAQEAKLNDHDSPGGGGDAVNLIIDAKSTKYTVMPSNLTGDTHTSEECPKNNNDTNEEEE